MANFKSVVLFLKIISLFIVQRNFGNNKDDTQKDIEEKTRVFIRTNTWTLLINLKKTELPEYND